MHSRLAHDLGKALLPRRETRNASPSAHRESPHVQLREAGRYVFAKVDGVTPPKQEIDLRELSPGE